MSVPRTAASFARWIRGLSEPVLRDTPLYRPHAPSEAAAFIAEFADERGHRRPVDRPLLSFMLRPPSAPGAAPHDDRGPRAESTSPSGPALDPDVELWSALAEGRAPRWQPAADGPMVFRLHDPAIEIGTERELCVLHAARRLAERGPGRPAWATPERIKEAAAWAMANLQPDNATNHPWAAHVFAELGVNDPEAALYAETLVSNSLAMTGVPDRFSACVLLDAARAIESKRS